MSELNPPPSPTIDQFSRSMPVFGVLAIVFGGASLVPFLGVVSPIGLVLGIIALAKKQKITGIIGTALSVIGIATSPILWALVICGVNPSAEMCKKDSNVSMEQLQRDIKENQKAMEKLQRDLPPPNSPANVEN